MRVSPAPVSGIVAFAVGSLLLAAGPAGAQNKLRGNREIARIWIQSSGALNFDPTVRRGEPQKVQLTQEYDSRYKARQTAVAQAEAAGKPLVDDLTRCLPSGMPMTMRGLFPFEIVTTPKMIYALVEGTSPPRRIYMDGRPIPDLGDLEPSYNGFSVGHWDGDTLVVETAGIKTSTLIDGVPHSDAMRVLERIRLVDDDTLAIDFIITDPNAFVAPWVVKRQYKDHEPRAKDPGKHPEHKGAKLDIAEYVCAENNRNLPDASGAVGATIAGE